MIKCCSRDNPLPPLPYLKVSGGIFYDMLTHGEFHIVFLFAFWVACLLGYLFACYQGRVSRQ
jgi:hypothetical protein